MPDVDPKQYVSDEIGDAQDSCTITFGGQQVLHAESWNTSSSVLSQPAKWAVRFGFETAAAGMYYSTRPRTQFQLLINGAPQCTGFTDSRELQQQQGAGGLELVISGRDTLAPLHDSHVSAQQTFQNTTYFDLVSKVLTEVGIDSSKLVLTNANNRRLTAGVPVQQTADPDQVDQLTQSVPGTLGAINQAIQAKVGQTWHEFLRKHLDRAGLMLWAGADGSIILSTPNAAQQPTYTLFRDITQTAGQTNVVAWSLKDSALNRHSEAVIYGRGGGRKAGRQKAKGLYIDAEMQGWGYDQAVVIRDEYVGTGANAAYFARRRLAEERREGWVLEYTIAGHTLPFGGAGQIGTLRAVVVPDTTVWVDDALSGIQGIFYIESVARQQSEGAGTTTTIRLMRPEDLVFGDIASPAAPAVPRVQTPQTGDIPVTPGVGYSETPGVGGSVGGAENPNVEPPPYPFTP